MQPTRGLLIGRLLGVPVVLHPSWLAAAALLAFELASSIFAGRALPAAVALGAGTALGVMAGLLAVEFFRLVAGRVAGFEAADDVVYVFGGVLRERREPPRPLAEAVVGAAAPLAAAALCLVVFATGPAGPAWRVVGWALGARALCGLLAALPFDGGRVAAALWWWWTGDRWRAERAALRGGRIAGLALVAAGGVAGFVRGGGEGVSLALGGLLVGGSALVVAGRAERGTKAAQRVASAGSAGEWARPFAGWVGPHDPLPSRPGTYAVADGGRLAGVLRRVPRRRLATAGHAMIPWTPDLALHAQAPLAEALDRLAGGAPVLVVVDERGRLSGVLDEDAVRERLG